MEQLLLLLLLKVLLMEQLLLWELERRLGEGQNLFLYSHDGHGRVGMVAGCLVGRLYGFRGYGSCGRTEFLRTNFRNTFTGTGL